MRAADPRHPFNLSEWFRNESMSPCFPFVHMKSVWMFGYHTLLQSEPQQYTFLVPERSHQASLKSVRVINQSRLVLNSTVACNCNFHLPFHSLYIQKAVVAARELFRSHERDPICCQEGSIWAPVARCCQQTHLNVLRPRSEMCILLEVPALSRHDIIRPIVRRARDRRIRNRNKGI